MPLFKLSSGGVTSVGLTAPSSILAVTGSPVTSAGILALALVVQAANLVWAGPATGAAADPTFRALVAADVPDLSGAYQPLNAKLTAISALANAAGVLTNNGSGVFSYTTPATGTVTSVALTLPGFLTVAGSPITTSGTLAVTLATQAANVIFAGPSSGGATAPTFRALVAADIPDLSATYQPLNAKLTAIAALANTSGVLTNNGSGVFSYTTPSVGTVTSVALTVPSFLSVAGSPVTTSGTLAVTLATEAANLVFAGPGTGAAASPTFRALVAADIPDLSGTYQPLNAKLTAISALANASGVLTNNGSGVFSYTTPAVGTVTSVGLAAPSIFSVSGSPVTGSGTLTFALANENANLIFAGPGSGAAAAPTFRALVAADIPDLSATYQPLNTKLTAFGALANANGVLTNNGSGVFSYTTPASGTVTSVALTLPSFLSVAGSPVTTSGTLAVTLATQAVNLVFAGPATGSAAAPTFRSLVAADIPSLSAVYQPLDTELTAIAALANTAGVLTNNGSGSFSYTTPGSGTVTSVALTLPSFLSVAGSPVTASGTFAVSLATQSANLVFAGPALGGAAAPTFRALVAADIPSLSSVYQPLATILTTLSGLADAAGALTNNGAGGLSWSTSGGAVTSVAGRTGAVVLAQADITGLTTASSPVFASLSLNLDSTFAAFYNTAGTIRTGAISAVASTAFNVFSDSGAYLMFGTGATERMRIDTSGNVGIGMTPTTKLDVTGTFRVSGAVTLSSLTSNGSVETTGGTGALSVVANTGTGNNVHGTAPTIAGGTHTALTALGIRSTGAAFDLTLASSEVLTAGRTLSVVLGDAARTLTLSGNPTIADWFDQSVKTTATPIFGGMGIISSAPVAPLAGSGTIWARGSTAQGVFEMSTPAADADANSVGSLIWADKNCSVADKRIALIRGDLGGTTANKRGGELFFFTRADNAANMTMAFSLDRSQNAAFAGSIKTPAPTGGSAQPWKLGGYTAGVVVQAGKVRVEINGAGIDLLTA